MIHYEKSINQAKKAAKEFGAEYQANPGSDRMEYLDSIAFYVREGVHFWKDLNQSEKIVLINEFNLGVEAEKNINNL